MTDLESILLGTPSEDSKKYPYQEENTFRWGTIVATDPVAVYLDGDNAQLAAEPDSLVPVLGFGDRVWCQLFGRKVLITGKGYPDPSSGGSWHYVGEPGEPPFENGWSNLDNRNSARFIKDSAGVVHLEGTVAPGKASNFAIFTLPPDYRPKRPGYNSYLVFASRTLGHGVEGDQARIDISGGPPDAGEVRILGSDANLNYVSLANIHVPVFA